MMSAVRSKNTKLELAFRRRLFAMGFRFRLHRKDLPGKPDMVFPKYSTVIFIHSCFWHYHGCHLSKLPQTRRKWWQAKLEDNGIRDRRVHTELRLRDWRVMTIWECSFRQSGINRERKLDSLALRARTFLLSPRKSLVIPEHNRRN
jgi:DNA mismatch endonuclease (patch repair protein)